MNRATESAAPSWQPGFQTAEQLREDWLMENGWLATPSAETLAHWAAVERAENEYADRMTQKRSDTRDSPDDTVAEAVDEAVDDPPTPRQQPFPSMVYLPCAEHVADRIDARVDMRATQDGRTALLTYSSLERLHECCGEDQAWIIAATSDLDGLQAVHPFQLLMLDVPIPLAVRRK